MVEADSLPLLVIVGPTASGKSSLAIEVARRLIADGYKAEIVNADSMLVYRGMDIGTAKPSRAELQEIPHHLVDIMEVTQTATVADFQAMARQIIDALRSRQVVPILVGGSSLYIRAIIDDFDFPGTEPVVRQRWQEECDRIGSVALHARLREINPDAADAILPGNARRVVRALEVIELTGTFQPRLPRPRYALAHVHQFGLRLERAEMDRRIDARVGAMWRQGLVAEVRGLVDKGLRQGLTASRGLGYHQVLGHLAGEYDQEVARTLTADGTRRLARKQLGWFKRDHRITWLSADDENNAGFIADL